MRQSRWGLERILAPFSPEEFSRDYWGLKSLAIRRDDPSYFSGVLTLSDVDRILDETVPRHPQIRVAKNGHARTLQELDITADTMSRASEAVYAQYRQGATIIMQFLQERWIPLGDLTEDLSRDVSARVQSNVYLTPGGGSQGFNPHGDTHDVFVLQLAGSKRWRLYEREHDRPLANSPPPDKESLGEPAEEFVLSAGDTLYIPSGLMHDAETEDETSLHVTLGVHVVTWRDLLSRAVERIVGEDTSFSAPLPLGFATQNERRDEAEKAMSRHVEHLVAGLDYQATIAAAAELVGAGKKPDLQGHLLDLEVVGQVDADMKVERRQIDFKLSTDEDELKLAFHGKTIGLPAHVLPQVQFVCESGPFTYSELPGDLDEPGRVVLISELLREGFLSRTKNGGSE